MFLCQHHSGNGGRNLHSKNRGGAKESPIPRVQLTSHILSITFSKSIGEAVPDGQYNLTKHKFTKAPALIPGPWRADHPGCLGDGTFRSDSPIYYGSVISSAKQSFCCLDNILELRKL